MTTHSATPNPRKHWIHRNRWLLLAIAAIIAVAIIARLCTPQHVVKTDLGELLPVDAQRAFVEAITSADTQARFRGEIESLREALKIPGLSAGVVYDSKLIWADGFGYADLEQRIAATADTPYGLASVTKPFAAFLLMKQAENGRLDLDTPISAFGLDLGNPAITVRHLLSHTSEGTPGSNYAYSGNRYSYLTSIIEQLYGDSFRNVLRKEILGPLQMTNTALNCGGCGLNYFLSTLPMDDPERAFEQVYHDEAIAYQYAPDYAVYPVRQPDYANAAAGLISSVNDLAKFAAAIEANSLVSAETKNAMFTPTVLNSGANGPYGLGWFTETYSGTKLIWHYGYGVYSTLFLMVPDLKLTFIVLGNTQNLSRPFTLGYEDASVLTSPFALAFYKLFVLQPTRDEPLPVIDWTAGRDAIVEQLAGITDPELRQLFEGELWTMRMMAAGVGDRTLGAQLLMAHTRAFPEFTMSQHDLYQVGVPGSRPQDNWIQLTPDEAARWAGQYRLDPAYAASGLPAEFEVRVYGEQILAVDPVGGCQELFPQTSLRLAASSTPDLYLNAVEPEGLVVRIHIDYGGTMMGAYDRVDSPSSPE